MSQSPANIRQITIVTTAVILLLNGCASSNHVIAKDTNPVSGEPLYQPRPSQAQSVADRAPPSQVQSVVDRAQLIYNSSTENMQGLLSYVQQGSSEFESVSIQRVGATTEIKFVSTGKGFFPPGAYALHKIDKTQDRRGLVFTDAVVNSTRRVLDAVKEYAGQVEIEATYAAQSDGLTVRTVRYAGDFGKGKAIVLKPENTTLNGKPATIRIADGEVVDNAQLAALRAVSLATFFHGKLNQQKIEDKFVLSTTTEKGSSHRWVELIVKITPAT